jgi:cytochrome c556
MTKLSRCALPSVVLLAVLLATAGCGNSTQVASPPAPSGMGGSPARSKQIMARIGKPPEFLTKSIGEELQAEKPDWDKLQTQASEYATVTTALRWCDPPKGSKESWTKYTGEFADTAKALASAVQEKDVEKAKTAHKKLESSCKECHTAHRGGRGPGG